jgi:hypothetical protein
MVPGSGNPPAVAEAFWGAGADVAAADRRFGRSPLVLSMLMELNLLDTCSRLGRLEPLQGVMG